MHGCVRKEAHRRRRISSVEVGGCSTVGQLDWIRVQLRRQLWSDLVCGVTHSAAEELGIASLPYADRQRIVIVPDEILEEHVEKGPEASPRSLVARARALASRRPAGQLTISVPSQVLDQLDLLRRDGVNVRPVARSEAHELELPAGALDGLVYVGDPACPTRYYLYSDFHVRAFEFKFTEAISLLGALGARSFEVRSEEGW